MRKICKICNFDTEKYAGMRKMIDYGQFHICYKCHKLLTPRQRRDLIIRKYHNQGR